MMDFIPADHNPKQTNTDDHDVCHQSQRPPRKQIRDSSLSPRNNIHGNPIPKQPNPDSESNWVPPAGQMSEHKGSRQCQGSVDGDEKFERRGWSLSTHMSPHGLLPERIPRQQRHCQTDLHEWKSVFQSQAHASSPVKPRLASL